MSKAKEERELEELELETAKGFDVEEQEGPNGGGTSTPTVPES